MTTPIGRPIHVVSTKYDGSPHWDFDTRFVLQHDPLLVTQDFAGQVYRTWRGLHTEPFDVRNHFWTDRWYNVMRCDLPRGGGLDRWYCNITTPALYDGETVRYVDLDLDVQVFADGTIELLDEDEFLENSVLMGYPPEVIEHARSASDEVVNLARNARFPFEELASTRS